MELRCLNSTWIQWRRCSTKTLSKFLKSRPDRRLDQSALQTMHSKLTPALRSSAPLFSPFPVLAAFFLCYAIVPPMQLRANDWPEWRGEGRRGMWSETGTLEKFPSEGLKPVWRVPIGGGYSG